MILFKTQMYHSCIKWIKIDDTIEKLYMCEKHQWHLLKIAQNDRNKILKLKLVNKESTVTDVGIGVNVRTTPSVITWLGNVTVVVLLEKLETIVKKVSSSYQKCLKFRMNNLLLRVVLSYLTQNLLYTFLWQIVHRGIMALTAHHYATAQNSKTLCVIH